MDIQNKATSINLFSLKTRPMRAFHMMWFSFFLCFSAWFDGASLRGKALPTRVRNVQ